MFANPKWFGPRKYTGWGLTPKTWQGWVYITAFILIITIIQSIPSFSTEVKSGVTMIMAVLLLIDTIDIMIKIKKDEREIIHEAIAERNVTWFIIFALIAGSLVKSIINGFQGMPIDPIILVAIFGGSVVKALTYFYLRDK